MLCGLNFIHSANLMHRDINPSNLLQDEEGRIIICDFGLSRPLPPEDKNLTIEIGESIS